MTAASVSASAAEGPRAAGTAGRGGSWGLGLQPRSVAITMSGPAPATGAIAPRDLAPIYASDTGRVSGESRQSLRPRGAILGRLRSRAGILRRRCSGRPDDL